MTKDTKREFLIEVPIYGNHIFFYFGLELLEIIDDIKTYNDETLSAEVTGFIEDHGERIIAGAGVVHKTESGSYIVILPRVPKDASSKGLLAHEIFHLAVSILRGAGLKLTNASEESYAYLVGYLTEQVYVKLGNRRILH